jgi:hypothetical protein
MKKNKKYKTRYLSLTKKGRDKTIKRLRSKKPNSRFTSVRNSSKKGYWIYEYLKPKKKKK